MVDFGARLRLLRQAKNMTQQPLADQLCLTKSVISAYETDSRLPTYDILVKICETFGITTDYLLGIQHEQMVDLSTLNEVDRQMVIQLIDRFKKGMI